MDYDVDDVDDVDYIDDVDDVDDVDGEDDNYGIDESMLNQHRRRDIPTKNGTYRKHQHPQQLYSNKSTQIFDYSYEINLNLQIHTCQKIIQLPNVGKTLPQTWYCKPPST